jgi:hypothetical protein
VASDGSAGTSEQSEITYFTNMQWNIVIDQTRKFVKYNYKKMALRNWIDEKGSPLTC